MSDVRPTIRAALEGCDPLSSEAISLTALPEGHVFHILGKAEDIRLEVRLRDLFPASPLAVRTAAPGQYFIVGDDVKPALALTTLNDDLQPDAFAIDQSGGRVRMRLQGPKVEEVLARGTAVDVALPAFAIGHATTTLIGHIPVHLARVGSTDFELMVLRSYAVSLWKDLARMSAAYI